MIRLAAGSAVLALLWLSTPASSLVIDLVDGPGSLTWDTSISVASPAENTDVSHTLFPSNRHPHEGWFIYLADFGVLHEFTNFTFTSNGVSQDSVTSTFTFLGEDLTLDLTYGITAVGPDGLPDLDWSGQLSRPLNLASPFPILDVRLFNVFDYDVGDILGADSATATQTTGPNTTLIEIMGAGGITGNRGAFGPAQYSVDTLPNILAQIQGPALLNDTAAVGNYDVAGAFMWSYELCSGPGVVPECIGAGSGTGGFGGFGGFNVVPEPSTAMLLLAGLALLTRARRTRLA
ncbi:MAG: PEP-CTERM sorting domain-containing protein [Myxococcota bacterium]